jgi:hypothetical protein
MTGFQSGKKNGERVAGALFSFGLDVRQRFGCHNVVLVSLLGLVESWVHGVEALKGPGELSVKKVFDNFSEENAPSDDMPEGEGEKESDDSNSFLPTYRYLARSSCNGTTVGTGSPFQSSWTLRSCCELLQVPQFGRMTSNISRA